jgi:hypothetical protein
LSYPSDGQKSHKSLPVGLQYLSKVWEPTWFLRIACALFFADIALAHFTGNGLLGRKFELTDLSNHAGDLAASLLGFCLLMSLGLPCFALCIRGLLLLLSHWIPTFEGKQRLTDKMARSRGFVTFSELRDHAYDQQSQFVLDVAKAREERVQAELASDSELAALLFEFTVIALTDMIYGVYGHTKTMLGAIWPLGQSGVVTLLILLMVVGIFLKEIWFPSDSPNKWVRFPPLAKAISDEEDKKSC